MLKRSGWRIYKEQMSQLDHGDALWEPAPIHSFKRIQLGDVGYVRRGRFHLLFSAGCPLGERRLGTDVPATFKPLSVGPIIYSQPRVPGYLCTNTVREMGAGLRASICAVPMLEPGVNFSFELTEKQGAALVTKYPTYREDIELESVFKAYTKHHYDSWVAFARDAGHGDDIKPVLVTGADMTRDFAMMAYSNDSVSLAIEFTTAVPMIGSASASAWGTWRTEGLVHTNCGPQLCSPPSSTQTTSLTLSGSSDTGLDEYNQCVFIRCYTMRKRALVFPTVITAAAGPHDLGSGGRDDEGLPEVKAQSDSDSDSDTVSGLWDDGGDDDRRSVSGIDSESNVVVHNTTSDEEDDFDIVADYIFQNSNAESVLIHHRDIALLRQLGGSTEIYTLLSEERPSVAVDDSGVGTIVCQVYQSTDTTSDATCASLDTSSPSPMSYEPTPIMPPNDDSFFNMHHGTDASTQSAPNAGFDLDSPAIIDLIDPTLSPHEQLLDSGYLFLPQVPYQFSQPTTPISIPIPLNQSYDFDPTGMSDSYSPVMDYGSHYPDQRYPSRNVPRSNTSFPATSFAPAYLSGSSGTPSTFNSPIRHLPHISPFTSSPSPPPPQDLQTSLMTTNNVQATVWDLARAYPATPGIPVPQKIFKPHTQSERRRYVEEVELEPPIMFYLQAPGECGIPLRDALTGKYIRLVGRDDAMFRERGPSVSIRLKWPGYGNWSRQIPTKDFRSPPCPITRSKLAKNIARTVERFIKEKSRTTMEPDEDPRWKVGHGHITINDLDLVGLQHVSKGSWQCHLRLNRPL